MSPDDPEWVDEIVRRALERAEAGDAAAAQAAAVAPADAAPVPAATPEPVQPRPQPQPTTGPVDPDPLAGIGLQGTAAPPVAGSPPPTPVAPAPRAGAPSTAPPDMPQVGEPHVVVPPAEEPHVVVPAAGEPRLPEPEDVVSSYDVDDAPAPQDAQLVGAGAPAAAGAGQPYPDFDEQRFEEAIGFADDDVEDPHEVSSRMRGFLEWGAVVVGALAVALIIKTFLMQAYFIPSRSMEPTLQVGDRVLVNKLSYDFGDISRGDLVVFNRPENQPEGEDDLIKRVIALPGETIEIREGDIFITVVGSADQQLLREPYLEPDVRTTGIVSIENCAEGSLAGTCIVPDDHVFVMGDNRPGSRDSRFFGPIPEDLVVGRAFLRVWPLGDVGFL